MTERTCYGDPLGRDVVGCWSPARWVAVLDSSESSRSDAVAAGLPVSEVPAGRAIPLCEAHAAIWAESTDPAEVRMVELVDLPNLPPY